MKTWDYASSGGSKKETGCCSLDSINDARQVAVDMGFKHFIVDIREEFGNYVIDNFIDEYIAGRTPNPCVLCNTHIKWEALLRRADSIECEFIATGHYAQINQLNDRYYISKGLDENKDQSYVLWGLSQACLQRTQFPIGNFTKPLIRQMALDRGYAELAKKAESYEICFVPDNDYRGFLKRNVEGLEARVNGGNFISTSGVILGQHKGYPFYTIGQRKGLEIALGKPMYVSAIDPINNTVTLGEERDLERKAMTVGNVNWLKYNDVTQLKNVETKIRYKTPAYKSTLVKNNEKIDVYFDDLVSAIAPGQSAVFYEGNDVIGGGHIVSSFNEKMVDEILQPFAAF
jgi:tRNA-specific 2-thiouridylase